VEVELQGLCGFNVNFAQVVWSSPRGLVESRFCNWSSFLTSRLNSKNLESVFHMMKLNEVMLDRFRCRFQPSIWSGPKPRLGCWIDELTGHGEAVKNAAKSLIACKLRPFIFVLWKYLKFKLFFKINIFLIFLNFFLMGYLPRSLYNKKDTNNWWLDPYENIMKAHRVHFPTFLSWIRWEKF